MTSISGMEVTIFSEDKQPCDEGNRKRERTGIADISQGVNLPI